MKNLIERSGLKEYINRCCVFSLTLLLHLVPVDSFADRKDGAPKVESANYSSDDIINCEMAMLLDVKDIGHSDMMAIYKNNTVYLPVNFIFNFLKIRFQPSSSLDSTSGFYINEKNAFVIDNVNNRITLRDTVTNLQKGDLFKYESDLYLNMKYFKSIFALDGEFNFRSMTVRLTSSIELPVVREAKLELMRKNIRQLRGEVKADTTIPRSYPAFHFGTADWAVISTQQSVGHDENRFNLGLGARVAGGELNASLNYYTWAKNSEKQQFYQWRYVNNDNTIVKQVLVGKIFTQSVATLYAPVVGVQITNAATTFRRAYGTYTLSNTAEPGWTVELYVNGVLVEYKKTDASGFYSFEVPLVYGYSVVKLRFYGPFGEERTTQQFINIPFNLIPVNELEYTAGAGVLEDSSNSLFSRFNINYGLSRKITVGGGVEYLSSVTSGKTMPFINTTIKLATHLLFSGDYTYSVRKRGILSYNMPSKLQLDLNYTAYDPGQTALYFNYLDEKKATLTIPVHLKDAAVFSRFSFDQITVPGSTYTNLEWGLTGTLHAVGLNLNNYASFLHGSNPYLYGLLSVSIKLPAKSLIASQIQYDYKENRADYIKFSLEKQLFGNGYFNASYQKYFNEVGMEHVAGNYQTFLVGMRYDFSFARVVLSAISDNNKGYTRSEYASGSLIYDHKTSYIKAGNRSNIGKGGITILPYLDINCNNKRDPGEPRICDFKVKVNGGRIECDKKDTLVRIFDLEPYTNCNVDLSKNIFENISWSIRNKIVGVAVSPDDFTLVEIPVSVLGEVSGMVMLPEKGTGKLKGERGITIMIYDSLLRLVAITVTEADGFFSYLGLTPGNYTVQVDSVQLRKLNLQSPSTSFPIHISQSIDGDLTDGHEFVLRSAENNSNGKDGNFSFSHDSTNVYSVPVDVKSNFVVLVDVFSNASSAGVLKSRLVRLLRLPVVIDQNDDDFKVLITGFKNRKEAERVLSKLEKFGFVEPWIIKIYDKHKKKKNI